MRHMLKWTPSKSAGLRRPIRLALMLMLSMSVTACATMTGTSGINPRGAVDTSCDAFRPISWSSKDTDQTIREAKAHNRVYATLCPAKAKR